MRVTSNMSYYMLLGSMGRLQESYHTTMEQIATQKRINRPSDDPLGMMKVMDYKDVRKSVEQYKTNISTATSYLSAAGVTLENIDDALGKIKSLALGFAPSLDHTKDTIMNQIKDLTDQIASFANNTFLGQYLFSGSASYTKPFVEVPPAGSGVYEYANASDGYYNDVREVKTGHDTTMSYTVPGNQIFEFTNSSGVALDLFGVLADLQNVMTTLPFNDAAFQAAIDDLGAGRQQIQHGLGLVSIKGIRFDIAGKHLNLLDKTMADLVDKTESSNVEELAMLLSMQKVSLDATYSVAAKLQQTTILNFLR